MFPGVLVHYLQILLIILEPDWVNYLHPRPFMTHLDADNAADNMGPDTP